MPDFSRKQYAKIDDLGIDPLKDHSFEAIGAIEEWSIHTVTEEETGNTPLIAYNYYGDPDLWWVIQHFNAVFDPHTEVTPGVQLRIPVYATVVSELSRLSQTKPKTFRI